MKKFLFLMFALFALFGFHQSADAATATSQAGMVQTSGSNLNVRASATTNSSIISKLPDHSYLTILSTSGSFYYVEYKEGSFGYVHKDYVDVLSSNVKKVDTGGANLNVRTGPSTAYYQFDKVKNSDYVIILSNQGSFSKVLFEGNKVGYVSNSYLSSVSNGSTYPAKKLGVPSYKQFDSRWAYSTIGNSGKTLKAYGCLTTSMAMTESYRTGITYTPVTIQNKLSYTSSGDMYWPSNYKTSTSTGYLSTAYQLLNQNKPMIIGFKNARGGQHWVVITGFTGGSTLSASNFIVNDPGSSSRSRLSEVISAYPYFYKVAYYS